MEEEHANNIEFNQHTDTATADNISYRTEEAMNNQNMEKQLVHETFETQIAHNYNLETANNIADTIDQNADFNNFRL